MANTKLRTAYTCRQAAEKLGVTDARIRQICIEHSDIGNKHGAAWLLTGDDLRKIRKLSNSDKRGHDRS